MRRQPVAYVRCGDTGVPTRPVPIIRTWTNYQCTLPQFGSKHIVVDLVDQFGEPHTFHTLTGGTIEDGKNLSHVLMKLIINTPADIPVITLAEVNDAIRQELHEKITNEGSSS